MDETLIVNQSVFARFWNALKSFFSRIFFPKKQQPIELVSRFRAILDELDERSPEYEKAYNVVMLCEEALRITRQRILHAEKIHALEEKMKEIECFDALTTEESQELQNLLTHYISLSKERTQLMRQITSFDSSLSHILELEDDAEHSAGNISEAEEYRRILKQDLGYLGGEKAQLEYEREFLEKGRSFIRNFTIAMVAVFSVVTVIFGFMYIFNGTPIAFPMSVMTVLIILIMFILYMFRRRVNYELALNTKKQKRAVELLNKKTAVFAHYTNYLNFTYKKYRVRSSQALKKNLKDVKTYKHLTGRIDNIRNIMYQTQERIEDFLREKKIGNLSAGVEHFAQSINVVDKKEYYGELSKERASLEKILKNLDSRHEEIWDLLIDLNDAEPEEDGVIYRIINIYLEEAERVFTV